MTEHFKITARHLARQAIVYLRQSSPAQVEHNRESTDRQYALAFKARELGWSDDRIVMTRGIADQDDARRDWKLDPMVLVRVEAEWSDRLAFGDAVAQWQTFQEKGGKQVLLSPGTGKPFASVEIVADIEPELRATLRKDEIVDAALGPQRHDILRPLRHTVDEHSANQIVRFGADSISYAWWVRRPK